MANYSDCTFKIKAKHIFQLKRIKELIKKEVETNSSSISELVHMNTDTDNLTLEVDLTGRWSVDPAFFREISREAKESKFIDAEPGSNFFNHFRYINGIEVESSSGDYLGAEHMAALPEDGDFVFEEISAIAVGYDTIERLRGCESMNEMIENYWNQYGGNIDEIREELEDLVE